MVADQQPAAYEPVIVKDAVFYIERLLSTDGEVMVRPSDRVEPSTEIASAMVAAGRPLMLNIARELGVEPDAVSRYLTKPVGSSFSAGEALARTRRGLRAVTCDAPAAVTMTSIDQTTGVATLSPRSEPQQLRATVYGEVESVVERRGVILRARGSRVQGFLGLGTDTYGQLKIGADRPDRELTADMVDEEFADSIVLGGMTLGTTALRRLVEVGARGVVVGSISDSEIRRFLSSADGEPSSMMVWRREARDFEPLPDSSRYSLTVFVTEGFGRRRIAQPLFQFLAQHENHMTSLLVPDTCDVLKGRPSLYITSDQSGGTDTIQRVSMRDGTVARLIDPQHLGIVVTCRSSMLEDPRRPGIAREVVDVEFSNGTRRLVPAVNLEVIVP
jgi:hypothetical protein